MSTLSLAAILSLVLRFPPVELNCVPGEQPLQAVTIVATSDKTAEYAAAWMKGELKLLFGIDAAVADKAPGEPKGVLVVISHTPEAAVVKKYAPGLPGKLKGPESYALRLVRAGSASVFVVLGADGPGSLYGAQTLADILRVLKGKVPKSLEAADHPEMKIRAKCGGAHQLDEAQLARFDWFARLRLNAIYYEVDGATGQKDVPDYFARLVAECARRGINLYGCLSQWRSNRFFGRNLNPTIPEHVAYIDNLLEKLASMGAPGLIFLFDDISHEAIEEAKTYSDKNPQIRDLADYQIFWLKRMVRAGRKHGISNFIMCPTPYHPKLSAGVPGGFDSAAYYRKLGPFCAKNDIRVFHCAVREKTVVPLRRFGVKHYIWWYNGVRDLRNVARNSGKTLPTGYYGFPKLVWGWQMTEWVPDKGVVLRKDALDTLRSLPQLTDEAWLCGSDRLDWGVYMWRPSRLDLNRVAKVGIEAILGDGSFDDYMRWERAVHYWAQSVERKVAPGRGSARERGRIEKLERDVREATEAVRRLKKITSPTVSVQRKQNALSAMSSQLKALAGMLTAFRAAKPSARVHSEQAKPSEDGVRLTRWITCANPWVSYRCRYVIVKREKDGTYHRAKWHFGAGLGMKGPSLRNWYDAGFIDVELDGRSLDSTKATWSETKTASGVPAVQGVWKTPAGALTMRLSVTEDKGLEITGTLDEKATAKRMELVLWTLPATGNEQNMKKKAATPLRTETSGQTLKLDTKRENVLVFYDENYDVPNPKAAGPCALRFEPGAPGRASVNLGNYIVTIRLDYSARRKFKIVLYDYSGCTNAEVLDYYAKKVFPAAK